MKQELDGLQKEKEGVAGELSSLTLKYEDVKADFEKQMKVSSEQATEVRDSH